MVKIAFIGAGSVVFAQNLIGDLLSYPELTSCTISLMDIDDERLEQTTTIAERMVAEAELPATIESTTDREEALRDADYVLNMIHVGGREPFENEIRIPEKYGVYQAVGDTLGPGGVFRLLRTLPVLLEIARDMERFCPDAYLLNYTNPMAMLCWAIDEATDIEVLGLCHSVQHTAEAIANYTNVPRDELQYWVAGINHMAWFLDATYRGESVYPALYDAMDDPDCYAQDNVRFEILRHFGAFVTESSNHMSEYVPYFRTEQATIENLIVDGEFEFYFTDWMETGRYLEHWKEYQHEHATRDFANESFELERSDEYGARIIHSIETDTPRRMNINVRNTDAVIGNLGQDACVEVPCLVDGTGIHPCSVGNLPAQLAALNSSNIAVQRLAVRGAIEGDLDAIRHAIKLDPLTAAALTLEEIDEMIDDLREANAAYLPDTLTQE